MKTILITGASSGIGKATAILFAKKGWNVAAAMRNSDGFSQQNNHVNIATYQIDVMDRAAVERCIKQVIQDFGKIDVIVNNAGIYTTDPLELTPDETISNIVDTNVISTLRVSKAILSHFQERKAGVIVNVSSIAGRVCFPFQSAYHTSKWAIEGLSESLRYELKPLNIKVRIVETGMVKTNIYNSVLAVPFEQYPDDYKHNFRQWHSYLMSNYGNGYDPIQDAKTIYKAVNHRGSKLRFTSDFNTRLVFFLRSLFPLSIFQRIITAQRKITTRSR